MKRINKLIKAILNSFKKSKIKIRYDYDGIHIISNIN
jgi:hypothetical protein